MARVRFYAAAAKAAGHEEEQRTETTSESLRNALSKQYPDLGTILPKCVVLIDGVSADNPLPVPEDAVIDILPPVAGK